LDSIYLDHNATTPLRRDVLEAMLPYLVVGAGNPSSLHAWGRRGRQAVEQARAAVARLLGCLPDEICFTAGGTEADNLAIKGVAGLAGHRRRVVTTAVEHPAVLGPCRALARQGYQIVHVPVSRDGVVDPDDVARAVDGNTLLISVMHANNETGVIQPVAAVAAVAWEHGIPLHVDAVQSVGKIPVRVDDLGVDLLALSAHKIGGPQGVGALYVRQGMALQSLLHGGGQEQGCRAGTENVAGIVGLGRAAERVLTEWGQAQAEWRQLRDRLEAGVRRAVAGVEVNGGAVARLPNTSNLSFAGVDSAALVATLDRGGVAVASGSACAAEDPAPSHVLLAMGLGPERATSAVRFSLGPGNHAAQIDHLLAQLPVWVAHLRHRCR
jgi:cysteine desulfurase